MNDRMPTHKESGNLDVPTTTDVDSPEPIPRHLYSDTYVGKSLADLIEQMQSRHEEVLEENNAPTEVDDEAVTFIDLESFEAEVERALPPLDNPPPALMLADEADTRQTPSASPLAPLPTGPNPEGSGATPPEDELTLLMRNFERNVRRFVQKNSIDQRQRVQTVLTERIAKVKQAAAEEIKKQVKSYRDRYRAEHAKREQTIRTQYDKLMALAHRISRQKAELQRARRELEGKLQATVKLQQEIGSMRAVLTRSIGNFDDLEADDSNPPAAPDTPAADQPTD